MASNTIVRLLIASGVLVAASCLSHYQRFSASGQSNQLEHGHLSPRQVSSFSCPEKNGRYPHASQCDAYYECVDGVAEEMLCPDGLLFNPEARYNFPCGYPIDIDCESRPSRQSPQPSDDCPHRYGYFKVGDQIRCGQFMNCVEGKGYIFDCPEGLAFNSDSYRCDWPDQVADCDAEAFLGFRCPEIKDSPYYEAETKFYRSDADCQRYFICVNGRPRLQNCGKGNAFNELINACDAAENVTGCEPPHILDEPTRLF